MTLHRLECLTAMKEMPENSVDSIVTDPPYELGFMGKSWDNSGIAYSVEMWSEALRILKPGGHLLAFGGTRTYHRMACAIEDAGFEIRDQIMWVYGSGFPKSMNVSKAISSQVLSGSSSRTQQRQNAMGENYTPNAGFGLGDKRTTKGLTVAAPENQIIHPEAQQWQGWGTALKPAHEPIVLARKPLVGTVAANVLEHGTGALNIDGARVGNEQITINTFDDGAKPFGGAVGEPYTPRQSAGRWPANFIHDGSDEVVALFPTNDKPSGIASGATRGKLGTQGRFGSATGENMGESAFYGDTGSAARFFYCAKANKSERNAGLDALPVSVNKFGNQTNGDDLGNGSVNDKFTTTPTANFHPTVKPLALMRYLVRLVTPPGGVVFDPFLGSGTTAVAAILEGFEWAGCEMTEDYWPIIEKRVAWAQKQPLETKEPTLFDTP